MTAEEKIDLLCNEHMNGLTTVWAVTKCLEGIDNFLIICEENGIITSQVHTDLINHYSMCAGDCINIILDDIENNDTMILAQQLDLDKEYLVGEILDLKHNIRKLQEDIARKDTMIESQRMRIESQRMRIESQRMRIDVFEKMKEKYGVLCEVRKIISDNFLPGEPECCTQDLSINKEDFDKLLKLLGLDKAEEQEVPDEVPED